MLLAARKIEQVERYRKIQKKVIIVPFEMKGLSDLKGDILPLNSLIELLPQAKREEINKKKEKIMWGVSV